MSSEISSTFKAYSNALENTRGRYEKVLVERRANALDLHNKVTNKMLCQFGEKFADIGERRRLHREIERWLGTKELDFVAIDGSCNKDPFDDFITFSACAYGAKGRLTLDDVGGEPKLAYRKWEMSKDVSMVSYVPIPYAQLADATENKENFLMSDQERVNLSQVHNKLMQLAEVYLAYNVAKSSSIEPPRLILMDILPSSVLASLTDIESEKIKLKGYRHGRRRLEYADIEIALAHPFSDELQLPNRNDFRLASLVLAEIDKTNNSHVDLNEFSQKYKINKSKLIQRLKAKPINAGRGKNYLGWFEENENVFVAGFRQNGKKLELDIRESWGFSVSLFEKICKDIFQDKNPNAMIYRAKDDDGVEREHWLNPDDIGFLTSVGLRALFEECWERNIMLFGIAKDSASRYFTRNYLGVLKYAKSFPQLRDIDVGQLPWTDRMFFEAVAYDDGKLAAPWATCEFDSAFMTLWVQENQKTKELCAPMGRFVAHTGLFARSLAQFFLDRTKGNPLMGHVIFIDRLLLPKLDKNDDWLNLEEREIKVGSQLGNVRVLGYCDGDTVNHGQDAMMYLLSCMTKNHYPEVIGYPDPLHKADWGAKTLADRLRKMIKSSGVYFAANPLSKSFRATRDEVKRR